jgi:hypothetical protein
MGPGDMVAIAFDPRVPLAPPTGTQQGTNPSIVILANAGASPAIQAVPMTWILTRL